MKNDTINLDDYISTKEYAEMHGVSPATVRSHIMKGNIECIKFGRISLIERTYPYPEHRYKTGAYVDYRKNHKVDNGLKK